MFSYFQSPSVTMTTFLQALSLAVDKQFEERKKLADCVWYSCFIVVCIVNTESYIFFIQTVQLMCICKIDFQHLKKPGMPNLVFQNIL